MGPAQCNQCEHGQEPRESCCDGPGACNRCYPGKPECCRGPSQCDQCESGQEPHESCCDGPGACNRCYSGKPSCCTGPSACNQCARPSNSTEVGADAQPTSEWTSAQIQQPWDWAAAGNWKEPQESTEFTQHTTVRSGFFVVFFLAGLAGLAVTMYVI